MRMFSNMTRMLGKAVSYSSHVITPRRKTGSQDFSGQLLERQHTTQSIQANPADTFSSRPLPPVSQAVSSARESLQHAHSVDGRVFGVSLEEMLGDLKRYQSAAQKPSHQLTEQEQIDSAIYQSFRKQFDIPDNAQPIETTNVQRRMPPPHLPRRDRALPPPPLPKSQREPFKDSVTSLRVLSPPTPPRDQYGPLMQPAVSGKTSSPMPAPDELISVAPQVPKRLPPSHPPRDPFSPVVSSAIAAPRPPRAKQVPSIIPDALPKRPPRLFSPITTVRPLLSLGEQVPFYKLFGWDLSKVTFKQQGGNTCYLLSSLDSILRNPNGWSILDKIKIHKKGDTYQVLFPGQRGKASEVITVTEAELNRPGGVESSSLGVRLIEKAYLKIPGVRAGRFDEPANAVIEVFGSEKLSTVNIQNSKNLSQAEFQGNYEIVRDFPHADGTVGPLKKLREFEHHIGDFLIPHEERSAHFKQLIQHAHEQSDADVLTAIRIGDPSAIVRKNARGEALGGSYTAPTGNHYYSIRLHESTPEQIVLADPLFDTSKPFKVPFEQFMQEYNIEGMRLSLT